MKNQMITYDKILKVLDCDYFKPSYCPDIEKLAKDKLELMKYTGSETIALTIIRTAIFGDFKKLETIFRYSYDFD